MELAIAFAASTVILLFFKNRQEVKGKQKDKDALLLEASELESTPVRPSAFYTNGQQKGKSTRTKLE